MRSTLQEFAERLMRCPAAPYHESMVAAEALRICQENGLKPELDAFGNILVRLNRRGPKAAPFVLAAHLDHPGFVVRKQISPVRWEAEFLGGVDDPYFKAGIPLRLMPGGSSAILGKRLPGKTRVFEVSARNASAERPRYAVWDLVDFDLKDDRITGRACDDLIGAATILDVMANLARSKARVNVIGVLSRAEEVGFHGALALAQARSLPSKSLVISLETSRELPGVQMGRGVIIRTGDRTSIFDSTATRFLTEVANQLRKSGSFTFQRALMSGGTCEATAYQEFGYRCAAVCVALGNYHNCGTDETIQEEYVSLSDAQSMSLLLESCAIEFKNFQKITRQLPARLKKSATEAKRLLRRTPLTV
jgi:putative aminopeptidase FrvX